MTDCLTDGRLVQLTAATSSHRTRGLFRRKIDEKCLFLSNVSERLLAAAACRRLDAVKLRCGSVVDRWLLGRCWAEWEGGGQAAGQRGIVCWILVDVSLLPEAHERLSAYFLRGGLELVRMGRGMEPKCGRWAAFLGHVSSCPAPDATDM